MYEFDTTTSVEKCISCDILTTEGNKCTYVSTSFSTDLSFYALTCSGPDPAIVKIYSTGVTEAVRTWQLNEALRTRLEEYALPRTEIFHIPVEGGFQAAVKMMLPPEIDFDNADSVTQKYPMLVRVYGGPGSVRINSAFAVGYQVSIYARFECLITFILRDIKLRRRNTFMLKLMDEEPVRRVLT